MDFPRADILRPSALVIAIAESIALNLPPCDETAIAHIFGCCSEALMITSRPQ